MTLYFSCSVQLDVQNIVQWRSFKPEVTTRERVGDWRYFTMNEKLQADATHRRALNQQTATTGLTITTNLLDNQEVFLNLQHEAAKNAFKVSEAKEPGMPDARTASWC